MGWRGNRAKQGAGLHRVQMRSHLPQSRVRNATCFRLNLRLKFFSTKSKSAKVCQMPVRLACVTFVVAEQAARNNFIVIAPFLKCHETKTLRPLAMGRRN